MNNITAILGASDPEMEMIERILKDVGTEIVYATSRGERVHPGNATKADSVSAPSVVEKRMDQGGALLVVECGPTRNSPQTWCRTGLVPGHEAEIDCRAKVIRIDHHAPGDPGYGKDPKYFLEASSIGQIVEFLARTKATTNLFDSRVLLDYLTFQKIEAGTHHDQEYSWGCDDARIGEITLSRRPNRQDPTLPTVIRILENQYDGPFCWVSEIHSWIIAVPRGGDELGGYSTWFCVPEDIIFTAAADHCLGAAYRGKCPGVDPDALLLWRVNSRARFQKRSAEDILDDINKARIELRNAPVVNIADDGSVTQVADMRRDKPVPELVEAATFDNVPYISGPLIGADGRHKYTVSASEPFIVKEWMQYWAPRNGITDIYGDPKRGFAGGYLKDSP